MFKRLKQYVSPKEAEKKWKQMQEAIYKVSQHPDFPVFIEYWETRYDEVDRELTRLKGTELEMGVKKREIVREFLEWIDNLNKE